MSASRATSPCWMAVRTPELVSRPPPKAGDDRQRLAAGDVGVVCRIEDARRGQRQEAVAARPQEVLQERAAGVDLVVVDAPPDVTAERADVARLGREGPGQLARHARADLVHVGLLEIGIDPHHRARQAQRQLVGQRADRLEGRRGHHRHARGGVRVEAGRGHRRHQARIRRRGRPGDRGGLLVDEGQRVSAPDRRPAVLEHVPREADRGTEVVHVLLVEIPVDEGDARARAQQRRQRCPRSASAGTRDRRPP